MTAHVLEAIVAVIIWAALIVCIDWLPISDDQGWDDDGPPWGNDR